MPGWSGWTIIYIIFVNFGAVGCLKSGAVVKK